MFVVSDEDAAAIRDAFEREGEFAAAIELRRRFPLIQDNAQACAQARTIAGWQKLPAPRRSDRGGGRCPEPAGRTDGRE